MRLFAFAVAAVVYTIFLASPATRAQSQTVPFPVAVSGTAAPAGGNYTGFSYAPVLNASGQVAFVANTSVSGAGIFAGTPGSAMTKAALQGTTAPAGGNYTSSFNPVVLNSSGQVAFVAGTINFNPTPVPGGGLFFGTPGSPLTAIAFSGTAAPAGGNYKGTSSALLNSAGQIAFYASLAGGTSTEGIFAGTPGSPLTTAALQGTASPDGGNYITLNHPVLNSSGKVAFSATLVVGGFPNQFGIFTGTPGSPLTSVALAFASAPAGGNYSSLGSPVINAAGQVAFNASLTGGTSTGGIFAGIPGSTLATVALQGTVAPAGGNFTGSFSAPVINTTGQVAFAAITSISNNAIFVGTSSSRLATVALQGTAAPNCGGATYSSLNFGPAVILNGSGQVVFNGTLTGTGVVTANNKGLFAGTPGSVILVVRKGDVIDVDPTAGVDNRTVSGFGYGWESSGGEDGRGMCFNDSGLLVYSLTFTDGSSGIFTSQIPVTAVPEPTTLAMIGMGLGGACFVWYRRQQRLVRAGQMKLRV